MKEVALQTLITAKALLDRANGLCTSENPNNATAGLIVLQDALELIFYALLIEKGIDENQNIDSLSFDQLIGALRSNNVTIPKSGTLKAMNKHRVITKHYGQLAEPATVRGYLEATQVAIDDALIQVVGKKLHQIYLTDLLDPGESLDCLINASQKLVENEYLHALIEIRKAIFIEFEVEYSIFDWREYNPSSDSPMFGFFLGGRKAHIYTKNKEWISNNVHCPTDYVQINSENLRVDLIEVGISTYEFDNLRRLTPNVFRENASEKWHYKHGVHFDSNQANADNVQYCLDRAIATILKKQNHRKANRYAKTEKFSEIPPFYLGSSVHKSASVSSPTVHTVTTDFTYQFDELLTGFDGTLFFKITCTSKALSENGYPTWVSGYLEKK